MSLQLKYIKHRLRFRFAAGTSRGVLTEKDIWILKVSRSGQSQVFGLGECAPLINLSPDNLLGMEGELDRVALKIQEFNLLEGVEGCLKLADQLTSLEFPSICFGLETALLDLLHGGNRVIFPNQFSRGQQSIPINGLVWMGDKEFMLQQVNEKIRQGFTCIKLKIGAIDFEQELSVLSYIRKSFPDKKLTLRVDANGAFSPEEAMQKLEVLSEFDIHSIEQPIAAGQQDEMARLCTSSPIPIALDEELIGVINRVDKEILLEKINPKFIILKPTLIGGITSTREWIEIAEANNIGWWMTSALESNIGLNAIAQLTAEYQTQIPQGLGTGGLYFNNFDSPLKISQGTLQYDLSNYWNYSELEHFT